MIQVLIKMTFANQIQKWMNCQRWWWFIDSSKVPRVSLARGTLYVHCTHMDVGRLGCSYILYCRLLACLPGCVAAAAGTAAEHGHREWAPRQWLMAMVKLATSHPYANYWVEWSWLAYSTSIFIITPQPLSLSSAQPSWAQLPQLCNVVIYMLPIECRLLWTATRLRL